MAYSADKKSINGTSSFGVDNSTTALLCHSNEAARKAECLRHILCLPSFAPSRPSHVKSFAKFDKKQEGNEEKPSNDDPVVESHMWMADILLDLVHKATCGPVGTQFHHDWHKVHHSADATFTDQQVPYDNIANPPSATLFPDIDSDVVGGPSSPDTQTGRSVMMLRHAAEIPPTAGYVQGDYSIATHDRSIQSSAAKDISSPQRLRITANSASPPGSNVSSPSRGIHQQKMQNEGNANNSSSNNHEEEFDKDYETYRNREALDTDADYRRQVREKEEREFQEAESRKRGVELFRWKLSVFRACGDADSSSSSGAVVAFAANPLSSTAIHRCSIQILAMNNDPDIPNGTSILGNGVFDRPGCMFGIVHKSALENKGNNHGGNPKLWNGLLWRCDRGTTMPGAALMVATTATGKPIAELPGKGKKGERDDHYVRVGDILSVETRPGGINSSSSTTTTRGTGFVDAIFNGNNNQNQKNNNNNNNNNQSTIPPVSVHFFINNVEVHSWANIAMLHPYCNAKALTDDSDVSRSPYNMDFMYFGVRLWKGTEVAIISGDPSRIVNSEMV